MGVVLSTTDLAVGYRKGKRTTTVLGGLNLHLHEATLVSLLGANGAGKSTLLRTLSGVQPPVSGIVRIGGKDIAEYKHSELSRLVSIVTTDRTFAGGLTVEELVGLGRQPHTGFLGRLGYEDRRVIADAIEAVGMGYKYHSSIAELSDGERQKVMIAKALAQEAPLIILDEPTAFLDVASRIEVMQLLHDLSRSAGKSILMSTHDVAQAMAMSDRLWLLGANGRVADSVTEDAVFGGLMDGLFKSSSIRFDGISGDYTYVSGSGKCVSVSGSSPDLVHWCENALARNGFRISASADLKVVINGIGEIIIATAGFEEKVVSVGQLLSLLKEKGFM